MSKEALQPERRPEMASSIYIAMTILALAALWSAIVYVWLHKPASALLSCASFIVLTGLMLNMAALRHVGGKATYSWATLPSWTYTVPVWIGSLLLLFFGLVKLVGATREGRGSDKDSGPAPESV